MTIWLITVAVIFFGGKLFKIDDSKSRKCYLFFAAILLIFVLGSRNAQIPYGSDINNYFRLFKRAIESTDWNMFKDSSSERFEMGYLFANYILSRIIHWPQFILYFQATVCVSCFMYLIFKNVKNDIPLAVLFFITTGPFQFFLTGFRQAIAISLCMVAYQKAQEKKIVWFAIFVALAVSCHQTAVVFIPTYYIVNMKHSKLKTCILTIAVLIGGFFVNSLLEFGNEQFDRDYSTSYVGNVLGGLVPILIYIVSLALFNIINKNNYIRTGERAENNRYADMRMVIIGLGLYIMRYQALVMERISLYYTFINPYFLTNNLGALNEGDRRWTKILAVICCLVLFAWRINAQIGDYVFFWS